MYIGLHIQHTFYWSDFNESLIFSTDLRKILKISNFMKIRPVGAEFHADGRTDRTKVIVAFRNFAKAPKTAFNKNPQRSSVK
jgi:hypothetical protein